MFRALWFQPHDIFLEKVLSKSLILYFFDKGAVNNVIYIFFSGNLGRAKGFMNKKWNFLDCFYGH